MKRWLGSPVLALVVFVLWLLLNGVSVGHLLLAALLALVLPAITQGLRPQQPKIGNLPAILKLAAVFGYDVVVANIHVARLILGPESAIRPGFIWVPLALTDRHAITVLSSIITLTPGTLTADLSPDGRHLLVHCLDLDDPQAMVDSIKQRYERPLLEIFR
jgi:multicomponent K+:H+ antiporter subunit E